MAKQYVTSQGETWDQIAFEIFGDESYMKELIEANPDYTGVFSFEGGILLDIPDINRNISFAVFLFPVVICNKFA